MTPSFRHTQTGYLVIVIMLLSGVFIIPALFTAGSTGILALALGLMTLTGYTFSGLTTEVYKDRVNVSFRGGLLSKEINLDDVRSVKAVRNKWYNGWGLRYIGNGWMYNVSGLDAVELTLINGKRFRIGTDKPAELEEAIWKHLPRL